MKKNQKYFCVAIGLFVIFVLWTLAVCFVDVAPIGPDGSRVGFATLNRHVHNLTGVHMALYTVTDWLGLVPILLCLAFAIFGIIQWVKRKSIFKVDRDIILLGVFYAFVIVVYVFFETVIIILFSFIRHPLSQCPLQPVVVMGSIFFPYEIYG